MAEVTVAGDVDLPRLAGEVAAELGLAAPPPLMARRSGDEAMTVILPDDVDVARAARVLARHNPYGDSPRRLAAAPTLTPAELVEAVRYLLGRAR